MPAPNQPMSTGADNHADLRSDLSILNDESGDEVLDPKDSEVDSDIDPNDLSDLEDDKDDKVDPDSKDDDKEDEDEEEEVVEDPDKKDDEDPEKKLEVVGGHTRPTIKQIKGKYPNFFKDFPDMRHMLFREGEYSTLFPTVDDAKDASAKAGDFERFSELLTSGKQEDFGSFLKGISEAGDEQITSMAANFLPALYGQSQDLYYRVTSPIAEAFIRNAHKAGVKNNNENLINAALQLANWAFEDTAYATGEKRSPPIVPAKEEGKKDEKYEQEKKDFYASKFNDTRSFINTSAESRLTTEIKKGLDPARVFNGFTTAAMLKEIMAEVGQALESDASHMKTMNSLWKQATKAGFAGNWKDRILTTYLSRARAVMPAIRNKVRAKALEGQEQINGDLEQRAGKSAQRKEVGGSGSSGSRQGARSSRPPDAKSIDWGKTSDMDLLNDKITLRK